MATQKRKTQTKKGKKTVLNKNRLKELLMGIAFLGIAIYLFFIATEPIGDSQNIKEALGIIGDFAYRSMQTLCGTGKILLPILFAVLGISLIFPQIRCIYSNF